MGPNEPSAAIAFCPAERVAICSPAAKLGERLLPALAQAARPGSLPVLEELRVALAPCLLALLGLALCGGARFAQAHVLVHAALHVELQLGVKAHRDLGGAHFLFAERSAMGFGGVDRVGRGVGDVRAHLDERGALGFRARDLQRPVQSIDVLGVLDALHMPAVGVHARDVVLGVEGDRGGAVDRDAVVVVADGQLAEAEVPGDRGGFLADALHHVAVGADRVGVVVHDLIAGPVEALGQEALGHRHADGVGDALAERPGGDLDAGDVAALGVAGRARAPLAEALQVLDRQVEAAQVRERVLQHARMPGAEHEAVAVAPGGVGWVEAQDVAVERVAERRERHRGAGMAGVRLLHGIHRQPADRVDRELAHLVLAGGKRGGARLLDLGAAAICLRS